VGKIGYMLGKSKVEKTIGTGMWQQGWGEKKVSRECNKKKKRQVAKCHRREKEVG
jgi:hypothetical protein